jgi:hypothetical protein
MGKEAQLSRSPKFLVEGRPTPDVSCFIIQSFYVLRSSITSSTSSELELVCGFRYRANKSSQVNSDEHRNTRTPELTETNLAAAFRPAE